MEAQLQELLDKIQKEGVEEAERKAALIMKDAEDKAAALLEGAKREAEKTTAEAARRASLAETRGKEALKQAARDLLLKLKETIQGMFDQLLKRGLKTALDDHVLAELAGKIVSAWKPGEGAPLEFQVSAADAKRLRDHLAAALAAELKKGVAVRPVDSVEAGFRVAEKGGSMAYDFSAAGLAEILQAFVNPLLARLVDEAVNGGGKGDDR
ncbi:MAG: hypothetical protein JXD23_12620 [Spirochaetales bacterium]|nr:hypothetical protein [Spirochaetales bacterium]